MIRYVPTSGGAVAESLTRALWALSRPPGTQGVTNRLFHTLICADGSAWLAVETEFDIPVHANAVLGDIAGILQPWIDGGHLAPETLAQLAGVIEAHKGGRLAVWEAFPQLFKDQSKTREELIAAGWLNQETP